MESSSTAAITAYRELLDENKTDWYLKKIEQGHNPDNLKKKMNDISPWLSDTVLISLIQKDNYFNPEDLTEVLVNNPQSATSPVIQTSLDSMTTPLPYALRLQIDLLDSVISPRTLMEAQISTMLNEKEYYTNEIINYYLNDTLPESQTALINFLSTKNTLGYDFKLISYYFAIGQFSNSRNLLLQIPGKYTLNEKDLLLFNRFRDVFLILLEQRENNRYITELSPEQEQMLRLYSGDTINISGIIAKKIICMLDSIPYKEWIKLPFDIVQPPKPIFGFLNDPSTCGGNPVVSDTLFLITSANDTLPITPAITDSYGLFVFNENEIALLDPDLYVKIATKSGYQIVFEEDLKISDLISESPVSLTFKNVNLEWYDLYDSPDSIWSIGTKIDISGNIYVAGRTRRMLSSDDVILIKYSPQGVRLWETIYDSGINAYDNANDMITDASGNCYISLTSENTNVVLLKYNSSGQLLWSKSLYNTANTRYYAFKVKLTSSGNVCLAGYVATIPGSNSDVFIAMFDKNGNQKWVKTFNFSDYDLLIDMNIDKNDNVVFTGAVYNSTYYVKNCITAKTDKSGNILWSRNYATTVNSNGQKIVTDNIGNIYVAGIQGMGSPEMFLVSFNANGSQQWISTLPSYSPTDMMISSDNSLYIGGAGSTDIFVSKYDLSGNQLWLSTYNGISNGYDGGSAIALDWNNNVYVTGWVSILPVPISTKLRDIVTLKISPDGDLLWDMTFNTPLNNSNMGADIVVSENSNVYVTGRSGTDVTALMATVKYSQCPSTAELRSGMASDIDNNESDSDIQVINFKENTITVYPNPYSDNTLIEMLLNSDADVSLEVYTLTGQCIADIYYGFAVKGEYSYNFSAKKLGYSAGTYILKATVNNEVSSYWLVEMK